MWLFALWLGLSCGKSSELSHCKSQVEPSICLSDSIGASTRDTLALVNDCEINLEDELLLAECLFLIVDQKGLISDSARDLCSKTTPFVEDCLRHAAAREVEQTIYAAVQKASPKPMKLLPRGCTTVS